MSMTYRTASRALSTGARTRARRPPHGRTRPPHISPLSASHGIPPFSLTVSHRHVRKLVPCSGPDVFSTSK
eukprot:3735510-Prymnesium_polylepis.1